MHFLYDTLIRLLYRVCYLTEIEIWLDLKWKKYVNEYFCIKNTDTKAL
jgi:hypothetical protein